MMYPVMLIVDGYTYESDVLVAWLQNHDTITKKYSPIEKLQEEIG